ncbi:Gypsy retrotransposon integrase-like protein 1, partial [Mucuna pruriens]
MLMGEPEQEKGWTMFFDGASNTLGHGIGAVLISPKERCFPFTTRLGFNCTNNMVEYEACAIGIAMALEYQIKDLKVYGDSALVIHKLRGEWETRDAKLIPYYSYIKELVEHFEKITFHHTPQEENQMVDALATLSSMFEVNRKAIHSDMTLLCCVYAKKAKEILEEIHEGAFRAHASGLLMARKILRSGYYWAKIEADCCNHVKRCHKCRIYVDNIQVPLVPLNILSAPWPFDMWGIDVIGPTEPKTSNGHCFILVSTYYFTKWVEVASYPSVTRKVVIKFIKNNIICRYGIPSHIITNNRTNFNNKMMTELYE